MLACALCLRALHRVSSLRSPTQETGVASVSIFYREVKKIAQGCVADEWRGWDLTLRCLAPEDTLSAPTVPPAGCLWCWAQSHEEVKPEFQTHLQCERMPKSVLFHSIKRCIRLLGLP